MPPKKGSKKAQGGVAGGKKSKAAELTVAIDDSIPTAVPVLNITSHPYILSLIIEQSPLSTLTVLARCSKYTFQAVIPRLYRNLRLSTTQFEQLIEIGNAPSKRGSMSGLLGRSFSPYLREGLQHVHALHITDYYVEWVIPKIPRGGLSNVASVYISLRPSWCAPHDVRLPSDMLTRISRSIRTVTFILSANYCCNFHPTINPSCLSKLVTNEGLRAVTIVFRPNHHLSGPPRRWTHNVPLSSDVWPLYTLRLVGAAHSGYVLYPPPAQAGQETTSDDQAVGPIGNTTSDFATWMDEQEPGAVFSEKEEAELRRIDRIYDSEI